jgi:hypothetical protein
MTFGRTHLRKQCNYQDTVKRWLERLGIVTAGMVGIFLTFLVVEHVRGRWMFSRRISGLESRGEILSVSALEPKHPPADENRAFALLSLSNRFEAALTNSSAYPPSMRFTAPGRAMVTCTLKQWSFGGKTTFDWNDIKEEVERGREVLIALRSAAALPAYDSGFNYQKGFVDFQLGPVVMVKRAIQVLTCATMNDLRQGQLDAAHSNLCALVKLAVNQKPEPLVISQLVRQACVAIAFNATWQALQTPGWTDNQLAAIQAAWGGCDLPGDMGRAFEMERAMGLDFYRQVRASRETLNSVLGQREGAGWAELMGSFPTEGFWLHYVHVPVWRIAWIDQDALRDLERWQIMIERERFARTNSWSALPGRSTGDDPTESMPWMILFQGREKLGWYDRYRFLFSGGPFGITDAVVRKTLFLQTQQQMVVTAIALARYESQNGKLPADLDASVPSLLPTLPKDWMDGKTLRYRARPEGGFVLYSVGEDGKDDGGDPVPSKPNTKNPQIWAGRDAMWPTAATAEEAEAAMKSVTE